MTTMINEGIGTRRLVDRVSMAHDASHYLLIPEVVITAENTQQVAQVMARAHREGKHVTFRSGGTSLSGQSLSDSILLDVRKNFRGVTVLDGGERVRCQPGATIRNVNAHLARFNRKLGPDPASEIACTVGGVVSDNSSGMSCGTQLNTYRTLDSLVMVLPSGTVIDTSKSDADEQLHRDEPELWEGLVTLRDRVRNNPESVAKITQQYAMKNVMGYGVNSFVDHDEPVHILEHLMIGAEGTLGFVAEATFRTVEIQKHAATALLIVPELAIATDSLQDLVKNGAVCLELMDAASLRVVQEYPEATPELANLKVERHAGLLVEATADDEGELNDRMDALNGVLGALPIPDPPRFTKDVRERNNLWQLRKGLYTSVAGARPAGTTNLLEDIAVPVGSLTETTAELQQSFARNGYDEAVIFGHAKDGNIHFMVTADWRDPAETDRYGVFTEDMVNVVLSHQGTLKAEHGTGRVMAPFVERQFGPELYDVMKQVKGLCDPAAVLNPGTLLTDDPQEHMKDLKKMPPVDDFVDRCVECGYCEPTCPSADLTTTPRRRIALLRAQQELPPEQAAEIKKAYGYEAVDTCAVDSLCYIACPVRIDTGVFMKTFRAARHVTATKKAMVAAADHWGPVVTGLRSALKVADKVPSPLLTGITTAGRAVISKDVLPLVGNDLPDGGPKRPKGVQTSKDDFVFFASCMGELFAPTEHGRDHGAMAAFEKLVDAAGQHARVPDDLGGLCCGTLWISKGFVDGADAMAEKVYDSLWAATEQGRLPVVCDAASCTHGLVGLADHLTGEKAENWAKVTVQDTTTWVANNILGKVKFTSTAGSIVIHPTCSMVHLGCVQDAVACAKAVSDDVVVPINAGCCAFAGDRGLLHPELTATATKRETEEVNSRHFDEYVSANRTCEMGMSRATGHDYRHVLEVLVEHL
ncbi:FAD-binding and (Fe-S)-binding domain-containing protein [Propionibacterium sp.]|uniref:FAD-binding and (Fe-S)-binding domain-containing protein n=1 Tax=Propionibacterium sp. TaxID=1977903 RepID=UPI0039EAE792